MIGLPDWQAADQLNTPDPSFPPIIYWEPTQVGPGTIMNTLGPTDGADLLDTIQASTDPVMKWGLQVVEMGKLDISLQATRAQLDGLVTAGELTVEQRDELFALSLRVRYPSWAEYNNTFVDAQAVGLARGGVE